MLANTIGTSFPKRLMIRARLRQFEYESNSVNSVCQIEHDLSTIRIWMIVELDVQFIELDISSAIGSRTRIGIGARDTWVELGWPDTKTDPETQSGSVFAPEEPSSNQVNRPQDPIRPRLSIALQLTSSISWLSSSITRNNRGGCSNSTSDLTSLDNTSDLTSLDKTFFFLVLNKKLMSWSFKTHGRGNRTSGWSF